MCDFSGNLARIRNNFVASLPGRLDEIHCQFERIVAGEDLEDCLRGLEREFHKIAGVAGSVGFADLGEACARIESRMSVHHDEIADVDGLMREIVTVSEYLMHISETTTPAGN